MVKTLALTVKSLEVKRSSFKLSIPDLDISPGQALCVVGANGSGKTTLLETIVGLIEPSQGEIKIVGRKAELDNIKTKKLLGYIPDDDSWIIPELTANEFFVMLSSIYEEAGVNNSLQNCEILSRRLLFNDRHKQIGSLSHGNKKKVQIIAALMHEPPFIVVDELRNGLDPIAIKRAEDLLKDLICKGSAILAATHDLWWAQRFADDIVMLQDGAVILKDSTRRILQKSTSLEQKFLELCNATNK